MQNYLQQNFCDNACRYLREKYSTKRTINTIFTDSQKNKVDKEKFVHTLFKCFKNKHKGRSCLLYLKY